MYEPEIPTPSRTVTQFANCSQSKTVLSSPGLSAELLERQMEPLENPIMVNSDAVLPITSGIRAADVLNNLVGEIDRDV